MNVARVIRWIFLALLIVTLLTLATPLAFTNLWLRNAVYILTVVLSFFVARQLNRSLLKTVITWLPISGFAFLILNTFAFSFTNRITDDWRTSWISHRQLKHKEIYIGEQMLDVGALGYARRTVKVVPVTPLFRWVTRVDTSSLDGNWISVNEGYNPYNLKY
jgi:hypothetical protein